MALIKIFPSTATTFTDNGLGGIVPVSIEAYEEINGQFELSLTHPIDDGGKWEKLAKFNIIYAPTHRGWQPFRIYSVDKSILPGSVVVSASHIFYDLLTNFVEDSRPENMTGDEAGDKLLADCQHAHGFTFSSDIAKVSTAYFMRTNPIQALIGNVDNSFANRWGGEIVRDGYTIAMNTRIGADNGVRIRYKKNLTGLRIRESTKAIATRIYPIATGAGNTVYILPEKYIDSAKISDYPSPYVALVTFSDIRAGSDEFPTATEIYAEMRLRVAALYAKGVDVPEYAFDANLIDLAKTEEYKGLAGATISLGDDVTVDYEPLGVDMKLRVVAVTYDCRTGRYERIVIGKTAPSLSNHVASIDNDISILKKSASTKWFDEIAKNIIPCYDSQVSASADSYNIAITQHGIIAKGTGTGKKNIAIGLSAEATGDSNITIGDTAKTTGETNIAIGHEAGSASALYDCIYIGNGAVGGADDYGVVVIGVGAKSNGDDNAVIGDGSSAVAGTLNSVLGAYAYALASYGAVLGYAAQAGLFGTAIGSNSDASGQDGIAIGQGSEATDAAYQIAIGRGAKAKSDDGYGIALGYFAQAADGASQIAIGNAAECFHPDGHSIAAGKSAKAYGSYDIAIGFDSSAGSYENTGLKYDNIAIGTDARAGLHDSANGNYYMNIAIGRSAAIYDGRQNVAIGRMAKVIRGHYNNVLGGLGWVQDGSQNLLIPMGDLQVYCKGDKNIIIGNAYFYDSLPGAIDEDKRILIGHVENGGIPLMHGHSDDGLTFQSQGTDKTPVRAKLLTGQTANAFSVLDSSDAILGGFEANGGAASIVNRNGGAAVKQSISDLASIPDELSRTADTKYLIEPTDLELAKYRAMVEAFDADIWGAM